jgi:hypothetical protein
MMISLLDTYQRLGWELKPVPVGQKACWLKGWPDLRASPDELQRHVDQGGNVGVRAGRASGGLVDIDLDFGETLALADTYLVPTGECPDHVRTGSISRRVEFSPPLPTRSTGRCSLSSAVTVPRAVLI